MSNKKDLRVAAKKIFEENTKRISDCYDLKELKEIGVIYVPADAPIWVFEIADFLKKQIERKYPKTTPVIIEVNALFSSATYSDEYLMKVYNTIIFKQEHNVIQKGERLLLCRTHEIKAMIRLHQKMEYMHSPELLPSVFLDVEAYLRGQIPALTDIKVATGSVVKKIEDYEPYWYRYHVPANYLVVYASGFECWSRLVHAWHEINRIYNLKPRIVYVNDLPVSEKYAAKMYKKFSDFLYWMSVSYTEMTVVPSGEPRLVRDIIGRRSTIVFIPQLKTYLCNKFSLSNVTFNIYKKSFSAYWFFSGPISRQCFCNELLNFMEDWSTEKRNEFFKFFTPRTFGKWNLKLYWWNHKRGVNDYCRRIFLQNFDFYKKPPVNWHF